MSKKKTPEAEAQTREELLAVASRVFLRDGYEAASMKLIADEADCTTGKLYSNYTKKEDFLAAFAKKLVSVNYSMTGVLLGEKEHPMMPYLLTTALVLETCSLNENFHELYYVGYSGKDTTRVFIEEHMVRIQPIMEQCGKGQSEDALFANGLMIAGIVRSLVASEYIGAKMTFREKMKHFVFASMAILGFETDDLSAILDSIVERKDAIHEAAYEIIIKTLSSKL